MNSKQQIFWGITGAVLAAAIGAYFSVWLAKPSPPQTANVSVLMTERDLPEKACKALQVEETLLPSCSIIAITLKNPSYEPVRNAHIKVDFKGALPENGEATNLELKTFGDFLSGDIRQIKAASNQIDYVFENFPGNGWVEITLISTERYFDTPRIAGGKNTVILEPHARENGDISSSLFLAGLVGLLILPAIALVVGFFQWLAKDENSTSKVDTGEVNKDNGKSGDEKVK